MYASAAPVKLRAGLAGALLLVTPGDSAGGGAASSGDSAAGSSPRGTVPRMPHPGSYGELRRAGAGGSPPGPGGSPPGLGSAPSARRLSARPSLRRRDGGAMVGSGHAG